MRAVPLYGELCRHGEKETFDQRGNFVLMLTVGMFDHCDHDKKCGGDYQYCDDVDDGCVDFMIGD